MTTTFGRTVTLPNVRHQCGQCRLLRDQQRHTRSFLANIITCRKGDTIGVAAGTAFGSYEGGFTQVTSFGVVNL